MSDLLQSVKRDLERLKCNKCNERTTITISGDKLSLKPCCNEHGKFLNEAMKKSMNKHAEAMLKNIFKK